MGAFKRGIERCHTYGIHRLPTVRLEISNSFFNVSPLRLCFPSPFLKNLNNFFLGEGPFFVIGFYSEPESQAIDQTAVACTNYIEGFNRIEFLAEIIWYP